MRRWGLVLAIVGWLVACQSGDGAVATLRRPIIGGTTDSGHPNVVGILIGSAWSQGICSGTLISPKVVVTAAHCVANEDGGGYPQQVVFGSNLDTGTTVAVTSYAAHPSYSSYGSNGVPLHDIGVVVLKTAATVAPAPFRTASMSSSMVGTPITFVGFGETQAGNSNAVGLKMKVSTTIGAVEAQGLWNYTSPQNPKNTCSGDSGGPGFVVTGGAEQLISVTSSGDQYCQQDGWNTRVDVNAAWLQQIIDTYDPGALAAVCGNGACESGESATSCPADCGGSTSIWGPCDAQFECPGDQLCVGSDQDNPVNDFCTIHCTSASNCPSGFTCEALQGGGAVCWSSGGSTGPACGDGTCEGGETVASCPADCSGGSSGALWGPCDAQFGCPGAQVCVGSDQQNPANDFCTLECAGDANCPSDFACQAVQGGGVCVPTGATSGGCGDGLCDQAESASSCPADCHAGCGGLDDIGCCAGAVVTWCDPDSSEIKQLDCTDGGGCGWSAQAGYYDCGGAGADATGVHPLACGSTGPVCGDGTCGGGETSSSCAADCPAVTTPVCGDGTCEAGETATSCAADCPAVTTPVCGDGTCEAGETVTSCATDCPTPTGAVCGNGICEDGESCSSCVVDCGSCMEIDATDEPDVAGDDTVGTLDRSGSAGGCSAASNGGPAPLLGLATLLGLLAVRRRREA